MLCIDKVELVSKLHSQRKPAQNTMEGFDPYQFFLMKSD